jgi:hypothetical protein
MIIKTEQLRQYLLGSLSAGEIEEIDLRIISDANLEESLIVAEETLIDDFLEGNLNPQETNLFRENYITTVERQIRVQTHADLKKYALHHLPDSPAGEKKPADEEGLRRRLFGLFSIKPVFAIIPLLVIAGLVCLIWFNFDGNGPELTALEREYVELNRRDFTDLSKFDESSRILLAAGGQRSGSVSGANELLKRKLTDDVFFNLALRTQNSGDETFQIDLYKNDRLIFTQPGIPVYRNEYGEELRFVLPAEILELGKYRIDAVGETDDRKRISYTFSVR